MRARYNEFFSFGTVLIFHTCCKKLFSQIRPILCNFRDGGILFIIEETSIMQETGTGYTKW
jgi:hypothetical protein